MSKKGMDRSFVALSLVLTLALVVSLPAVSQQALSCEKCRRFNSISGFFVIYACFPIVFGGLGLLNGQDPASAASGEQCIGDGFCESITVTP